VKLGISECISSLSHIQLNSEYIQLNSEYSQLKSEYTQLNSEYTQQLGIQSVELRVQSVELKIDSEFMLRYTRDKCRVDGLEGRQRKMNEYQTVC
jgi:archaellum component FlaC